MHREWPSLLASGALRELDVGGRNGAQMFSAPLLAFGLDEIQIAVVHPQRPKPRRLRTVR